MFGVMWGSSLTAVVDGAEAVRNKHAGSLLLFQDGVYIAEQRLFRVRIKCGGLHSYQSAATIRISEVATHSFIKEQKRRVLQNKSRDCKPLLFATCDIVPWLSREL